MKNLLVLLCLFSLFSATAQENEDWDIKLGKRKNLIFRNIQEINLGNYFTSYNPLYFKIGEEGEWQKVGVTGKKILPYIPSTEFSAAHFKKYKTKKIKSYWCLGLSSAASMAWGVSYIDFVVNRRFSVGKSFVQARSIALLVGGIGISILGNHWNTRGDLNLFMAVNGEQVDEPKPALSWYLWGGGNGELLLGLRF